MFSIGLIFYILACVQGAPKIHIDDRIVGGNETNIEKYPYQISLQRNGLHSCGGSIISKEFILTAAHCTDENPIENLTIRVGSSARNVGGDIFFIQTIHQHPFFNPETFDYDVSIIRLNKSLEFAPGIEPIGLVSENWEPLPGSAFVVTGWGAVKEGGKISNTLQVVKVPFVDNKHCQKMYIRDDMEITDRMMCAGSKYGNKDSCQGDSGGPLVSNGYLAGVVSWGTGCARPDFPGVYTRVSKVRNYIDYIVNSSGN